MWCKYSNLQLICRQRTYSLWQWQHRIYKCLKETCWNTTCTSENEIIRNKKQIYSPLQHLIRSGYNWTEIRFPCFLSLQLTFSTIDLHLLDISKPGTTSTLPSLPTFLALSKTQRFNQVREVRWKHIAAFWNTCLGTTEDLWSMKRTLITALQTARTTNARAIVCRNTWREKVTDICEDARPLHTSGEFCI